MSNIANSARGPVGGIGLAHISMGLQLIELGPFGPENKLKPLAVAQARDPTEVVVVERLFDGLALAVDGLHNYRHGQASQQPVAPSLSVAVYVASTVAAALRWLVAIESSEP